MPRSKTTNHPKHLRKSDTIQESNHGSGVCKEHYYVQKSSILLAGTGLWKISSVACAFSSIKNDYFDYPKSLSSRIKDIYVFFSIKYCYMYSDILLKKTSFKRKFCCIHTCYCVNMVSVTSASRYITSTSRYDPRYQKRFSMYICGLIPRNFAKLAEAVPIATKGTLRRRHRAQTAKTQLQYSNQLSLPLPDGLKRISLASS